jgi:hypothetical protein
VPEATAPRIGVRFALTDDPGELFADARAVEAADADSLWADGADGDPYVLLAAFAAVTWRVRLIAAGAADDRGRETCERLARGRLAHAQDLAQSGERWIHVGFPKDRDEWRAMRASAAESGATGIVLPNDPRLIDLLRNPDVVDDRSDLNIATG